MRPGILLKTTALVLPLSLAAGGAYANDLVQAAKEAGDFETFGKAIEAAGLTETLAGDGPFTVFAPTDEAFMTLPEGALDQLLQDENQDQLRTLLAQHVIEGEAIMSADVMGARTEVTTLEGDGLTVDGTTEAVMLIPDGAGEIMSTGQEGEQTPVAEGSGMPTTEHQQQALESEPAEEQQQTAADGDMPATEHQEEVLAEGAQTGAGQTGGTLREARVVEADIEADNGVIHAIDAVLVPQKVVGMLEGTAPENAGQWAATSRVDPGSAEAPPALFFGLLRQPPSDVLSRERLLLLPCQAAAVGLCSERPGRLCPHGARWIPSLPISPP